MDRKKVITEIEDALSGNLARAGHVYRISLNGLKDKALKDALSLLKEQEAEIERLKRPDCEHANHDGAGCLGYCGCEQDDEPIDACKQCEKYTGNICAEY